MDVVALEGHRAGGGAGVSGDQPRQRGLAGAGPADDGRQRAGPGGQRDVVEQLLFALFDGVADRVHLEAAGAGRGLGAPDQGAAGEDQVDVSDCDDVALGQHRRPDPDAVDEGAVDAVRVADLGAQRRLDQERVVARRQDVLDDDVVVGGPADRLRAGRFLQRARTAKAKRLEHLGRQVRHLGRFGSAPGDIWVFGGDGPTGADICGCGWIVGRRRRRAEERAVAPTDVGYIGLPRRAGRCPGAPGCGRRGGDAQLGGRPAGPGGGPGGAARAGPAPADEGHAVPEAAAATGMPIDSVCGGRPAMPWWRPTSNVSCGSVRIPDVDALAVVDVDHRHPPAVHESAVERTVVDRQPPTLVEAQQQMRA